MLKHFDPEQLRVVLVLAVVILVLAAYRGCEYFDFLAF